MRRTGMIALSAVLAMSFTCPAWAGGLTKEQVPAGAKWVLHLDAEGLLASETGGAILAELKKQNIENVMAVVKNLVGLDPLKDIKSVTLYGTNFEPDDGVAIINAKMDKEKLLTLLKANPTFKESKYGEHAVYEWVDQPKDEGKTEKAAQLEQHALKKETKKFGAFQGDNLAVMAQDLTMLQKALDLLDGKGDSLAKEKDAPAASKGSFFFAFARDLAEAAKKDKKNQILKHVSGANLNVGERDGKLFAQLAVNCKDDRTYSDLKRMAEGLQGLADLAFMNAQEADAAASQPSLPPGLGDLLMGVLVVSDAEGKTILVKTEMPIKSVKALIEYGAKQQKAAKGGVSLGVIKFEPEDSSETAPSEK